MEIRKCDLTIKPDFRRVITLTYNIEAQSVTRIARDFMKIEPQERRRLLEQTLQHFGHRHRDLESILAKHFKELEPFLPADLVLDETDRLTLATYFTKEYSVEAAALFNPSIVSLGQNSAEGSERFVLSLRATGEGHISSIEFLEGQLRADGSIELFYPQSTYATGPDWIRIIEDGDHPLYEIQFQKDIPLSEQVIFPLTDEESNGMEDVRLVRFEEKGETTYYGTFTAYDGFRIQTKLLETRDFKTFRFHTLAGNGIEDKGMALFPQKINGRYAMISRQDGNNLFIMFSDNLFEWNDPQPLMYPKMPWELTKIGNCGSPLLTDRGWLLITHGVGPMRKYQLGACLLDFDDPRKVIGRLHEPLLGPEEHEREGYVPNVVYTCGALVRKNDLVLPYAMSDSAAGIALFDLKEVLDLMDGN